MLTTAQHFDREAHFAAFTASALADFWQTGQEGWFYGVDKLKICYVYFRHSACQQAIVMIPGRLECYLKYQELAYDLFYAGYDVFILDHRGQGFSDRLLADTQRGHVERFSDYVDDLHIFWQSVLQPFAYQHIYGLAHSMGGAILALFLARYPATFTAAVLSAPMFGIILPLPRWLIDQIFAVTEQFPRLRNYYVLGTTGWRPLAYLHNRVTHSQQRYDYSQQLYSDTAQIRLGGPTYHWLNESLQAAEQALDHAAMIKTPILLLQASQDTIVDNQSHFIFCQRISAAGHPCFGDKPYIVEGARHEIFFERDSIRAKVIQLLVNFFEKMG